MAGLTLALAALAAAFDWRTGHIPNWLTLGSALLGLLVQGLGGGIAGVGGSALGLVVAAAIPLLLYRAGGVGGGDVKLLAAVGALGGVTKGVELELYAFVIAAAYAGVRFALVREREVKFGPSVLAAALCQWCGWP
jgi:prepilin peptidase CpaA